MPMLSALHRPGLRVRVTQQMPSVDDVVTTTVEGEIVTAHRARTGSWFAHGKDNQLWLDRLELRLDDGEIMILNLDQYSVIESLDEDAADLDADEGDAA